MCSNASELKAINVVVWPISPSYIQHEKPTFTVDLVLILFSLDFYINKDNLFII